MRDNRFFYRDISYDAASDSPVAWVAVAGFDKVSVSIITEATTGAVQFVGSANAGGPWVAVGSGPTITGQDACVPFSVSGIAYLGIKCSTAQTGKTGVATVFMTEGA